jgi:hypothetical protein
MQLRKGRFTVRLYATYSNKDHIHLHLCAERQIETGRYLKGLDVCSGEKRALIASNGENEGSSGID